MNTSKILFSFLANEITSEMFQLVSGKLKNHIYGINSLFMYVNKEY
jgi:hypothetical protein